MNPLSWIVNKWNQLPPPNPVKPKDVTAKAISGWFILILLGIAWLALREFNLLFWGEREGYVRSEDCRIKIPLKQDALQTWFKAFTCSYEKTARGHLLGGTCEAVQTTSTGACEAVYFYELKPDNLCTDPKFPRLGSDDICHP